MIALVSRDVSEHFLGTCQARFHILVLKKAYMMLRRPPLSPIAIATVKAHGCYPFLRTTKYLETKQLNRNERRRYFSDSLTEMHGSEKDVKGAHEKVESRRWSICMGRSGNLGDRGRVQPIHATTLSFF